MGYHRDGVRRHALAREPQVPTPEIEVDGLCSCKLFDIRKVPIQVHRANGKITGARGLDV